jgi:hypothetical protein
VRAYVAAQGWTLVAEHEDVASGKDDRRPGFQAALARCRPLTAVLVAKSLDRITRPAHTLSQLSAALKLRVRHEGCLCRQERCCLTRFVAKDAPSCLPPIQHLRTIACSRKETPQYPG